MTSCKACYELALEPFRKIMLGSAGPELLKKKKKRELVAEVEGVAKYGRSFSSSIIGHCHLENSNAGHFEVEANIVAAPCYGVILVAEQGVGG